MLIFVYLQSNSSNLSGNSTIYSSVTQKLRKERGQNLDAFICTFMQSIEQSTDIGEDVIEMKETKLNDMKPHPPGVSLVFGDLFGVKSSFKQPNKEALAEQMRWLEGPSECLIYICKFAQFRYIQRIFQLKFLQTFQFHFQ